MYVKLVLIRETLMPKMKTIFNMGNFPDGQVQGWNLLFIWKEYASTPPVYIKLPFFKRAKIRLPFFEINNPEKMPKAQILLLLLLN